MGSHHYFTFINQLIILINDWLTVKRMVFFFSIEIFHKAQSLAPFCQKATVQRLFVHCDK